MESLWTRRTTNSSKLSLTTAGSSGTSDRNTSSRRLGADSSSNGKSKPFIATAGPTSPTAAASSAFGLGSGAFASFGPAKIPKTPGHHNPPETNGKAQPAEKTAREVGVKKAKTSVASSPTMPAAPLSHPLRNPWTFWFRPPITKANGYLEYEKTIHQIATVATVEDFFAVYRYLKRPSSLPLVSDYHLFEKDVRPIWEDDVNRKGGKWVVRLRKGVADRYWEDLLLAMIGDQFGEASDEVCGAVLSVRNGEDILSIWVKSDGGRVLKIRETMKRVLACPPETNVVWKSHDTSLQQRAAIEESRREKASSYEKRQKHQQAHAQHTDA